MNMPMQPILDHHHISWSFEDQNYEIEGNTYKPDSSSITNPEKLEKIVEVKSPK